MPKSSVYPLPCPLPLAKAKTLIEAARAHGKANGMMPLTVVVLDTGGHIIAMEREDGSGIVRQQIAQGKAWGALGIGVASRTVGERNQGRDAFMAAVGSAADGRFIPVPGGVLIIDNGQAIGAVGISGDTSDADEACAIAGVEAAGYQAGIDTPD
ncbi:MAG: heme-binding protein [Spiribacter sp.]|jgi:Uncharacterized protein, possibly involved in utilization of glycolate and propanediol|nr:heme-binding protein [Spiribacter sp.]MDR9480359.1 heme-binding protein [Spiribacter sp.]